MDEHDWARMAGYALIPILWLVVLSTILWLVRRFIPRHESTLFGPIGPVLRRFLLRIRAALRRA
jgi:hypothetical protein